MQSGTKSRSTLKVKARKQQRGVALIIALLLLLLLSSLGLVMVLSSNSDLLTNGYYRGFRGAFYAADSGLSIVRQDMANQLVQQKVGGFSLTTQALPSTAGSTVQSYLSSTYGTSFQNVSGQSGEGSASNSWPGSYQLTSAYIGVDPSGNQTWSCVTLGGSANSTCASPVGTITAYQYTYPYQITVQGRAQGTEKASVTDEGTITVTANLTTGGTTQSFAAWGMFIDQQSICSGSTLVPGTISGPVFTNGAWTFGTSGQYIFTDQAGSASSQAGYQFSGSCSQVAGPSASQKSGKTTTTIAPTFQQGFSLGQSSVPLPQNDYNQAQAVLDGKGVASTAPTNSQLHAALMDVTQTAYPSNGTNTGVFLPYSIVNGTPTFNGGGIYIQGNASVTLSTSGTCTKNASGMCTTTTDYAQVYTITQGNKTTTITVDPVSNTTTMVSGNKSVSITGVPEQYDPTTNAAVGPATMLYDNGAITALSGPGQGVPAVQDGTALTVTANGNVTITGDILYKTEPVTTTQNQIANTPADTLIPGNNNGQSLGIFTANGNVNMNNSQSNGNLEIDASVATICASGSSGCNASSSTGGLTNTGSSINTLNIIGGRIQSQIMNIGATTRNVFFDRRYANGALSPPWFPSTTINQGIAVAGAVNSQISRTRWTNNTAYY